MPFNQRALPNCDYIECDLLDSNALSKLPKRIDVLVHLAGDGRSFIQPEEYTRQILSNIVVTANVADYATTAQAGLVVFASSGYVYSGNTTVPFREDSITLPAENLGSTKLGAESMLKARAIAGQFKALSLRIFTVFGPGSPPEQFIPEAIVKLTSSDMIAKFRSPDVKRDFVFIDDVVQAFIQSLMLRNTDFTYDVFNIGTGLQTSTKEAVLLVANILGTSKQIEFDSGGRRPNPADTDHQADVMRSRSVLNWQAQVPLDIGLRRTIESMNIIE